MPDTTPSAYGELTGPTTLTIQRLLPGPIERVWAYLTESDLRKQWLASGVMQMSAGAAFEFVWRNDELTDPPAKRPAGFDAEYRMQSKIIEVDPPRKLVFTWAPDGEVTFELNPQGSKVLLTVIHRRISDRPNTLKVSAGWHTHLDILAARLGGEEPQPFWDVWQRLHSDYDKRLPA
jgi:uncharacterized protein YndB with AHSA1/START domain